MVGCVGRIKLHRKGQEVLLHAAGLLEAARHSREVCSWSARPTSGTNPISNICMESSVTRGSPMTWFSPASSRTRGPAYAAMNVFVLPSAQPEPFGGVVMEAMCMGLPVVATNIGGSVEQVAEGETGYLVSPGDAGALADKLELLLAR